MLTSPIHSPFQPRLVIFLNPPLATDLIQQGQPPSISSSPRVRLQRTGVPADVPPHHNAHPRLAGSLRPLFPSCRRQITAMT